jgi:hypothetical protein
MEDLDTMVSNEEKEERTTQMPFARNIRTMRWPTIAIFLLGVGLLLSPIKQVIADEAFSELHMTEKTRIEVRQNQVPVHYSDRDGALNNVADEMNHIVRLSGPGIINDGREERVDWDSQQLAQFVYFDRTGVVVGAASGHTFALEVADLDGDGDLDLVSADESGSIIVWENNGTPLAGGWPQHQIGTVYLPVGLAVGDLDRDGDLDLAAAHADGPTIWRNDGSPFEGAWSSWQIGALTVGAVRIADMNGDERLDLITGGGLPWWHDPNENNQVTVWQAPELPFSQSWSARDVGLAYYTVMSLDVGDLDEDGDNDIVIGTEHAPTVGDVNNPVPREDWPDVYQVRAFRNDGGWDWTAFDVGRDPKYETFAWVPYVGFWGCAVTHVTLTDLDDDGDLDILSSQRVECDYMVIGWQNDGTPFSGELWAPSAISKGYVHNWLEDSVLWTEPGDFDQDGDLDVVSGGRAVLEPWQIILWENSGITFGEVISDTHWIRHDLVSRGEDVWTVRVGDFDRDSDLDLTSAVHVDGPNEIRIWENRGPSLTTYLPFILKNEH